MAKARIQVRGVDPNASLRPAAAPVDMFQTPTAGRDLQQLAQGLADLAPGLARFSDVLAKQKAEADYAAGQQRARELTDQASSFSDAIKKGKLLPSQSPWFMAGLQEQFGRVAADNMNFKITAAIETDPLMQTTTDIGDFQKFWKDQQTQWVQDNLGTGDRNPHFEKGFGFKADAYLADAQRQFAAGLGHRVVTQMNEGHFAEVKRAIINEFHRGTAPAAIAQAITDSTTAKMGLGMNGGQLNRTNVAAVVAAAMEQALTGQNGDERKALQMLDLLHSIPGGPKGAGMLADQSYGSVAYTQAVEDVSAVLSHRMTQERQQQQQHDKQAVDSALSEAIGALATDPFTSMVPYMRRVAQVDPQAAASLASMQDAMTRASFHTDEAVKNDLFSRIWNQGDVTPAEVTHWVSAGKLTAVDGAWLVSQMHTQQDASKATSPVNDDALKTAVAGLRDRFIAALPTANSTDRGDALYAATASLKSRYNDWRTQTDAGKSSTLGQQIEWVTHEADALVAQYRTGLMDLHVNPTPAAQFAPADWHKELVVGEADLAALKNGLAHNSLSADSKSMLRLLNIPADQLVQFIQSQDTLLAALQPKTDTKNP